MTKYENKFVPSTPKTYEVRYLENQSQEQVKKSPLSVAARQKVINRSGGNYVSENHGDYGPCKNSLCGCSCYSYECNCMTAETSFYKSKDGVFRVENHSFSGRIGSTSSGLQYSSSHLRIKDEYGDAKIGSGTGGAEIGITGAKVKANIDVVNAKSDGVQARLGYSADTGVTFAEDKLEAKVLGVGFSIGKQIGVSGPIGEVKVDTDKCVIQ